MKIGSHKDIHFIRANSKRHIISCFQGCCQKGLKPRLESKLTAVWFCLSPAV